MSNYLRSDLPPGTLVIERYVYKTPKGNDGIQWLSQIVSNDGHLLLMSACKTRREALDVAGRSTGALARSET